MKKLISTLAVLALASCSAVPSSLSQSELKNPATVEASCKVLPVGFDGVLTVGAPPVEVRGLARDSHTQYVSLSGVKDGDDVTFGLAATRLGLDWVWIKSTPEITLRGNVRIPAIKIAAEVRSTGGVEEVFSWVFSRAQLDEFAATGLRGDVTGGGRVRVPASYFQGFLARWEKEVAGLN